MTKDKALEILGNISFEMKYPEEDHDFLKYHNDIGEIINLIEDKETIILKQMDVMDDLKDDISDLQEEVENLKTTIKVLEDEKEELQEDLDQAKNDIETWS